MKKTKNIILALTLCLTMLLFGCTDKSPASSDSSSKNSESSGEKPVIEFYHGYFQTESEWPVAAEMRKIYDEFAEANKDDFTFKPIVDEAGSESLYNKAVREVADGKMFDMADLAGWNIVPSASAAGLLVDLKPFIDKNSDFKAGVGVCYDQNLNDGKIYSIREQVEAVGFWYNEEMFNEAKATLPSLWKNQDDFAVAVEALVKAGKTPFALNQGWPTNLLLSQVLLGTAGGPEMLNNAVESFDNPAFKSALDFVNKNALQKIESKYFTGGGEGDDQYRDLFIEGKSAMLFNGVWEAGALADSKFKPAVFPTADGKKASLMSGGAGFVINAKMDEAKINACVKFLEYMTSKPIAERILKKSIGMPPSTAVDYSALKGDSTLSAETVKLIEACELVQSADYQGVTIGARWDMDLEGAIGGKYAGLKDNSKTVDKVIEELNKLLNE